MPKMTLIERAEAYRKAFPKFPPLSVVKTADGRERIEGVWILGNNYHVKTGYYGGYPHGYLDRVRSLFSDIRAEKTLHLFSGQVSALPGEITFDCREENKPNVVGRAEHLREYFYDHVKFNLILADPPYSVEDAEHYGTPLVNRKKVIGECHKVLKPGGFLVWLDQVFPMFSKRDWHLAGTIGIVKSTNHRVRFAFIFQREG